MDKPETKYNEENKGDSSEEEIQEDNDSKVSEESSQLREIKLMITKIKNLKYSIIILNTFFFFLSYNQHEH